MDCVVFGVIVTVTTAGAAGLLEHADQKTTAETHNMQSSKRQDFKVASVAARDHDHRGVDIQRTPNSQLTYTRVMSMSIEMEHRDLERRRSLGPNLRKRRLPDRETIKKGHPPETLGRCP